METLTINIDSSSTKGKAFLSYLKALANDADGFLSIENLSGNELKENRLLAQIEEGLQDVKKIKTGKAPKRTLSQMLDE